LESENETFQDLASDGLQVNQKNDPRAREKTYFKALTILLRTTISNGVVAEAMLSAQPA
jgi:hypothetical protein